MITDDQFKEYINQLSDSYKKIKDIAQKGDYFITPTVQDMLGELSNFRDIACTALRNSHVNKNFNDN